MTNNFITITNDDLHTILGGEGKPPVSPETAGCAVGGALAAAGGPWSAAAGCIAGGALANAIDDPKDADKKLEALKTMGHI